MSQEERYTNDFLNILAYFCENETMVSLYLIENKLIVGKIIAMTEHYIEVSTLKYNYIIPIKSLKYFSTEKERIGK